MIGARIAASLAVAAALMAAASVFAVVWQSRKTRRVNTDEHRQNAAILRRHKTRMRHKARPARLRRRHRQGGAGHQGRAGVCQRKGNQR